MTPVRAVALRTASRPAPGQLSRIQPARIRLSSTSTGGGVGDKGTSKVYNKDGTNPNKNLVYLGLGALGLGGVYAMFMAKPEKVAEKAQGSSSPAR
ncbi:hypothetical protein VTH82DRAFT_4024 [Thermothelomyces myriococcoides]